MKKSRSNLFAPSCAAFVFPITSSFLLSITTVYGDINQMTAGNNLGSGGNWSLGAAPTSNANPASHTDLLFTTPVTALIHTGTILYGRSYNVTNGSSYTITSSRAVTDPPTSTAFRIGSLSSGTSFTNEVVPVVDPPLGLNDLVYLSNNSNLTFNGVNSVEGGQPPALDLRLATGNFNISEGSTLTVGMNLTGTGGTRSLVVNGNGTTVLSGTNSYTGTTTLNGGSLEIFGTHSGDGNVTVNNGFFEISGTHSGNGALTHADGLTKISGIRSGTGATNVRNGILEITGTNAGTAYSVNGTVNPSEPVLKLGNVNALPVGANISGSNSVAVDGIVDLAVAGAYVMGSHVQGNITYTTTSGSPTTLTFSDPSKVTTGANSTRTFNNSSPDLSIVFNSTLDIGGTLETNVNITATGNITVEGGVICAPESALRTLNKGGTGTLTLKGVGTYTGATRITSGVVRVGSALAIPGGIGATGGTSNIVFAANTAVIGLTAESGDFLRTVGPGADQITANPAADPDSAWRMGFAAFGGDRLVNFGAPITLSTTSFAGAGLALGATTADSKVTVVNDIDLASASRTVLVHDGTALVDAELSGVITSSDATLVKSGDGTLALTGANTYGSAGGGTEVLAGVLVVNGTSLSPTSSLVVNGGKVESTGIATVDTLFFGDEQQIAGTWGSSTSSAEVAFQDDARFSGTGVVIVTSNPVAGSGYEIWAEDNAGGQTADLDFDNDGVSNGVEFFMGETGSTFTPNPGVTNDQVTWPRDPAAAASFKVQVSDTLASDGWTDIVPPHVSIDETDPNEVVFSLPTEGPKNFCRLVVNVNP